MHSKLHRPDPKCSQWWSHAKCSSHVPSGASRAEEVIKRAPYVVEVEEAKLLQAEAANPPPPDRRQGTRVRGSAGNAHRCPRESPRFDQGAAKPSDRQDLESWVSNRNCEMRIALEFGDAPSIGTLLSQGSVAGICDSRPADGREVVVVNDEFHDRRSRCEAPVVW